MNKQTRQEYHYYYFFTFLHYFFSVLLAYKRPRFLCTDNGIQNGRRVTAMWKQTRDYESMWATLIDSLDFQNESHKNWVLPETRHENRLIDEWDEMSICAICARCTIPQNTYTCQLLLGMEMNGKDQSSPSQNKLPVNSDNDHGPNLLKMMIEWSEEKRKELFFLFLA